MYRASDIMSGHPAICGENTCIYDAFIAMRREDSNVIPVVDADGRCIGILTEADICRGLVMDGLDPRTATAGELMNSDVITCHPDEPLSAILRKMEREQLHRLPVINDKDQVVGMITEGDIARIDLVPNAIPNGSR